MAGESISERHIADEQWKLTQYAVHASVMSSFIYT